MTNAAPNAETLLRHLPVGVVVVRAGRVESAAGRADALLGRSERRIVDAPISSVLPPEAESVVGRVLAGSSSCTAAGIEWDRAGTKLSISGSPGPDPERVVLVIAPATEPDDHPRGESFQGRLAWLSGLAAGLAHEIRNPLGGIRGAAQLLRRSLRAGLSLEPPTPGSSSPEAAVTDELDELTSLIIQEADRIGDRVTRLMELVRPAPLRAARVSLNALVHDGVALLRLEPRFRDHEFRLDLDPSLPPVEGDPVRLAEAVGNLVRNAAEAAECLVIVRSRVVPDGRLRERGRDRGLCVRLDVQDDGPGIPAADEQGLFVPFATTKLDGSGLGLFVARLAVEDHGGGIDVRPRPAAHEGLGTTGAAFGLLLFERLPASPPRPVATRPRLETRL